MKLVYSKFKNVYNNVKKYPKIQDVADALGVSERTIRRRAKAFKDEGKDVLDRLKVSTASPSNAAAPLDLQLKVSQLTSENSMLKKQIKDAHKEVLISKKMKELIHGTTVDPSKAPPKWLTPTKKEKSMTGIPLLFLSDFHYDEVVDTAQIGYVNKFNHVIANERIRHTFKTSINLLNNYMVNPTYDGIVCALGGDMLSGNIHEELAETNHQSILKSSNDLADLLIEGLSGLADSFGKVFVPCVVGNHGRLHHKPRHKNKVFDNHEWLVYQNIAKYFGGDDRLTFYIPDGPDAQFSIYDKNFLLTHGDQFRGGSGIAGIFSPLMMGMARKQKKHAAIGKPFDIMMCGHFHQYIHANSLIVNGSLKGYDEYASNYNFAFEHPQQALFIVHPTLGVTYRIPVMCDSYEAGQKIASKKKLEIIW